MSSGGCVGVLFSAWQRFRLSAVSLLTGSSSVCGRPPVQVQVHTEGDVCQLPCGFLP